MAAACPCFSKAESYGEQPSKGEKGETDAGPLFASLHAVEVFIPFQDLCRC